MCLVKKYGLLFSFCIHPKHRNAETAECFIKKIEDSLTDTDISVCLYSKNTRAISFFEKNGYVEVEKKMDGNPVAEMITLVKYK